MNADNVLSHLVRSLSEIGKVNSESVSLALDGNAIHTKVIALLEKTSENLVHMLFILPNTSYRLQLLDVSVMSPLSIFYFQDIEMCFR